MAEPFFFDEMLVLAKAESTYATDPTPTGSANAVQAFNGQITPLEAETRVREFIMPHMGNRPQKLASRRVRCQFGVELSGSGTAGTAPAAAPLILACAFAETLVSGNATVQASPPTGVDSPTGTFTYTVSAPYAGNHFRTVTLTCTTAGGSGVAEFSVSAPAFGLGDAAESAYNQTGVVMTDSMAFALPGTATITPTIGTSFVLGDEYTIDLGPPRAEYDPVSDRNNHDSVALYYYAGGARHAVLGARGNMRLEASTTQHPMLMFDFTGLYVRPVAEAVPTPVYTAWPAAELIGDLNTPLFSLHGHEGVLQSVTLDWARQVQFVDRVGRRAVRINDFTPSGDVVFEAPALATKNFFASAEDAATGQMRLVHGLASGALCELLVARAEIGQVGYSNDQEDRMLNVPYRPLPSDAGDDDSQLLFY